jgi:hypothetical protein
VHIHPAIRGMDTSIQPCRRHPTAKRRVARFSDALRASNACPFVHRQHERSVVPSRVINRHADRAWPRANAEAKSTRFFKVAERVNLRPVPGWAKELAASACSGIE